MLAVKISGIWFNDQYILNSLPLSFLDDDIILVETEAEGLEECRTNIRKSFSRKEIAVNENYVFFEMKYCKVEKKRITWMFTKKVVGKLIPEETQTDKILPNVRTFN